MIVETFNQDLLLSSGNLFSQQFEDRGRFAFHGTSTVYSDSIETGGLQYPFFPINPEDLENLANSLDAEHKDLAGCLRASSQRSTRISLAPYSYIAANHAITKQGGQVVGFCKLAIGLGGTPSARLIEQLSEFDKAAPCVFAVDISGYSRPDIQFEAGVFQSMVDIPAARVIAKVLIPGSFEFAGYETLTARMPSRLAGLANKSLAQALARFNSD
jgi:hypothetical protein